MKTAAALIRALRKRHGLTQTRLGDALGVSVRAVQDWEGGVYEPRADDLERLARYLGCEVAVGMDGVWRDRPGPLLT